MVTGTGYFITYCNHISFKFCKSQHNVQNNLPIGVLYLCAKVCNGDYVMVTNTISFFVVEQYGHISNDFRMIRVSVILVGQECNIMFITLLQNVFRLFQRP